jgi:hypothetical protein
VGPCLNTEQNHPFFRSVSSRVCKSLNCLPSSCCRLYSFFALFIKAQLLLTPFSGDVLMPDLCHVDHLYKECVHTGSPEIPGFGHTNVPPKAGIVYEALLAGQTGVTLIYADGPQRSAITGFVFPAITACSQAPSSIFKFEIHLLQ